MATEPVPPLSDASATEALEQGLPIPHLVNALPDFVIAAAFACAWFAPGVLPATLPRDLLTLLLLEFIVLHSAAFMGVSAYRAVDKRAAALVILGLGAFYSLFAGGFALAMHSMWPLVSFWVLTLNRLGSVLLRRGTGDETARLARGWAGGTVGYLGAIFLGVMLPLPAFGITASARDAMHLPGSGLWVSQPWRAFASGMLYFAWVAWNELNDWRAFRVNARDLRFTR